MVGYLKTMKMQKTAILGTILDEISTKKRLSKKPRISLMAYIKALISLKLSKEL